jgi:hypothetical protein
VVRIELSSDDDPDRRFAVDEVIRDISDQYGSAGVYELVQQLATLAANDFRHYIDPLAELEQHERSVLELEDRMRRDPAD